MLGKKFCCLNIYFLLLLFSLDGNIKKMFEVNKNGLHLGTICIYFTVLFSHYTK